MISAETIGFFGGTVGILSSLPQTLRIRKLGHAVGVSLPTWLIMYASTSSWLGYGIKTHSISQVVTNSLASILIISVLFAILRNRPRTYLVLLLIPTIFILTALSVPSSILSIILFAFSGTRIPQIIKSWKTWKTGAPSAVSIHTWSLSGLSASIWFVYAVISHRAIVEFTSLIGVVFTVAILSFEFASKSSTKTIITIEPIGAGE